ncbi:thioredoxin O2, mitochondrial-like isoform X2 [Malus sylvestris]|uniref:thioredoxin O2, mitochondrial-like isoform X2 n=1 Tax=Malus sylvestris TaxID=3752 RepID=UPI0021AC4F67|nr:thioredoxin O2, mitochondrial-like isoform X2 [Malus sylvestris]
MARNLGVLVRQLLPNSNRVKNHTMETLILAPSSQPKPFSNCFNSPNPRFLHSGRSRICSLYSEARYRQVMFELEDVLLESKPSVIFFFSAPSSAFLIILCAGALVSPVLQDLIVRFPHVKAYKIDASKEDSDYAIRTLDVRAVAPGFAPKWFGVRLSPKPAVAFIKDGEWVSNCVGANIAQLKYTFEALYGEHPIERPPYLDRIHV